ncbi:MAG: helix-turn-helix transcriptional regulator [Kiritimatiellae bacterium]|nr:helix-turn-helix transcriptional regulator [Kiritimatiellia bacterium]
MVKKIRRNRFAERLKTLRTDAGLNQVALAQLLGVTQVTVSLYESGRREPDLDDLMAICDRMHTTPNKLLGYDTATSQASAPSAGDTTHGANSPIIKVNGSHNTIAPPSTSSSPSTPRKKGGRR